MKRCDCWTDSEGYWQLGPNCLEAERASWRRAMDNIPGIIAMLKKKRQETDDTTK